MENNQEEAEEEENVVIADTETSDGNGIREVHTKC